MTTPVPPSTNLGGGDSGDVEPPWADRWAANMSMVIRALQRLHAVFDDKFVHPKSNP